MATKTIKSSPDSKAGLVVAENVVRQSVNKDNSILIDEKGTTISGPISLVSATNHIRVGGLWTFNDPFKMTLPSTYACPTPTLMIDPPVKQFKELMQDTMVMIGLLGAISTL